MKRNPDKVYCVYHFDIIQERTTANLKTESIQFISSFYSMIHKLVSVGLTKIKINHTTVVEALNSFRTINKRSIDFFKHLLTSKT